MAILLDPRQMIDEGIVENERVEYKRGWNPEPILHTICAFANDIENQSGGYIIVGIDEKDGMPGDVVGVDRASVDRMNGDLLNLCNLIDPRYIAESECFEYEGRTLFVIKAPGGWDRPYRCPVSLSDRRGEKAYYIRHLGRTIRASRSDERDLFRMSEVVPFDDRVSDTGRVSDLSYGLMREFLGAVNSRIYGGSAGMDAAALAERLRMVRGPAEDTRPVNVGLMFFNDHPEDFFRMARVEVVSKPNPTGNGMTETVISGPLDRQLTRTMSLLQSLYIREHIDKIDDRPESTRVYNYPPGAVEEALSNAIYHKAYDIAEPITVTILQDRMEITSIPGPERGITDAEIRDCSMRGRRYRNRRIGEVLKDLGLVEGRNTGIPRMLESMESNGSPRPVFETDEGRTYLTVVLPVNPAFLDAPKAAQAANGGHNRNSAEEMAATIVELLERNGEMSVREISEAMGYKSPPSSLRNVVRILIAAGRVSYLYPESPNAPNQRLLLR